MQETMGLYEVPSMEHPLLIMEAAHINRIHTIHTIHMAEIYIVMMTPMVITGDHIIEGRIVCSVAASSLLLEMLELTYLKLSFGSFLVNATNW
jgi:hypothetical protein